jgi:hypothetical protein
MICVFLSNSGLPRRLKRVSMAAKEKFDNLTNTCKYVYNNLLHKETPVRKTVFTAAVLLLACTWLGFAEPADNFQAGGLEFGGELSVIYQPDYGIFNADEKDLDSGEYYLYMDGSANIGIFLVDRLSVNLMPSVMMIKRKYYNDLDGKENKYTNLFLGLAAGCNYYLVPASSLALSVGLNAGVTVMPGIDGIDDDLDDPDDSLALFLNLEPNVACYYFVSEHLAPYLVVAPELNVYRQIKNSAGDKYDPPDTFLEDIYLQLRVKLGVKYFLPEGGRFQGKYKDIADSREGRD